MSSQEKVNGISRAIAVMPLTPGRIPKNIPMRVPRIGMRKFGTVKKPMVE